MLAIAGPPVTRETPQIGPQGRALAGAGRSRGLPRTGRGVGLARGLRTLGGRHSAAEPVARSFVVKAGVLQVVAQRRVGGATERTYTLRRAATRIDPRDWPPWSRMNSAKPSSPTWQA